MQSVPVTETSQIAEGRRRATQMAAALGADEAAAGRVALIATELATNILKHGGGGELLLDSAEDGGVAAVQLIALDRGRGIANVQECMRDGYSTAGSAGHGLGAIKRQSNHMEVATWPGLGTAILVRASTADLSGTHARPWHGSVCVPMSGEEVCGDACAVFAPAAGKTLVVIDGLGHGAAAAAASMEAIRLSTRHQQLSVPQLLDHMHAGLRPTRGAAVAIARWDKPRSMVVYGGIGNIAGAIVAPQETRRMISLNGTAGHVARRIQTFDYPYDGGLVVMHSDGLGTGWSLDRYPGITRMHPTLIAAVLYRDYSRRRDDTSVLVADLRAAG